MRAIFVGGTGRSGTTATARLLGHHSSLATPAIELQVHVMQNGLSSLLNGLTTFDKCIKTIERRFQVEKRTGRMVGLDQIINQDDFRALLDQFSTSFPGNKEKAARQFIRSLLDSFTRREGKQQGWVEHTPKNVLVASTLLRLFPDLKIIHSVRDGRDAASSITRRPWGPDTLTEAIRWWGHRMRQAHSELSLLPPEQVLILPFEDLVQRKREETYRRILDFLELDDEPGMRTHFEQEIRPEKAHIGRWEADVPADQRETVNALYREVLDSLEADGVPIGDLVPVPPLAAADGDPKARQLSVTRQPLYEAGSERDTLQSQQQRLIRERDQATQEGEQWSQAIRQLLKTELEAMRGRLEQHIGRSTGRTQRDEVSVMGIAVCKDPVFIVGAPRSGTSMMRWAMCQHSGFWGGQESDFLIPLIGALRDVYAFGSTRGRLHWLSGQQVTWPEFLTHIGNGVNSLYMSRSGCRRWIDKSPRYTLHLDEVADMFPGAVFLFMLRDGRQVVESLRHFVNPADHIEACHTWRQFTEAGLAFARSDRGDRMYTVRYPVIVEDTEAEMRRISQFLGVGFEPETVAFIRSRPPINSSFPDRPPAERSHPAWASWSRSERHSFQQIAGDLLIELGFETDSAWIESK